MNRIAPHKIRAFGSAAAGIAVAALFTRACPGGCGTCNSCAAAIAPMSASLAVVGTVLVANVRRGAKPASSPSPELTSGVTRHADDGE